MDPDPRKPLRTLYNVHQITLMALRDEELPANELRAVIARIHMLAARYQDLWTAKEE